MTRRPVVAMVTDSVHPFFQGGKESRYREVVRRLSRTADVHVYTMKWWDGPATMQRGGVTYHAICPRQSLYASGRRSLRQAAVFGVACLRLAAEPFDTLEADHIPYAPLFVLRAICLVRRKRFVVTWHEVWGKPAWRTYLGRAGLFAWWVERAAMLLPDEIVAASEQTARRLKPYVRASTQVRVAPNGLDLEAIRSIAPAPSRSDLVFVGRLLAHKNVDLLISSLAILRREGLDLTCRIVGRGPELPHLRRHAAERGVSDLVEFLDDIDEDEDVYAMLKAADVFVFPSVREGFGISALEAIACGLPVVTTSHPDNLAQHLVSRTSRGVLCDPDAAAIALAIRQVVAEAAATSPRAPTTPEAEALLMAHDWDAVTADVASALGVARV